MYLRERLFDLISAVDACVIYFVVGTFAASATSSVFASEENYLSVFLNDKLTVKCLLSPLQ